MGMTWEKIINGKSEEAADRVVGSFFTFSGSLQNRMIVTKQIGTKETLSYDHKASALSC